MPDTRDYDYFVNKPGCNQVWEMARGKEQPDSITFYDTDEKEHNRILINNRYTVTPWVSEDKLTINLFGVQDNCVEICPLKYPNKGRGLVDGKFRI